LLVQFFYAEKKVTKKGSWSPSAIIFAVNGHQESSWSLLAIIFAVNGRQERFLELVSDHFLSKGSPRTILGAL
jgi:hypothetical protein